MALWKLGWGKKIKWTVRVSLDLVSHTKAPRREQVDFRTGPLPLSAVSPALFPGVGPWGAGAGNVAGHKMAAVPGRGERRTRRDREMAALPAGRESRQRGGARPLLRRMEPRGGLAPAAGSGEPSVGN